MKACRRTLGTPSEALEARLASGDTPVALHDPRSALHWRSPWPRSTRMPRGPCALLRAPGGATRALGSPPRTLGKHIEEKDRTYSWRPVEAISGPFQAPGGSGLCGCDGSCERKSGDVPDDADGNEDDCHDYGHDDVTTTRMTIIATMSMMTMISTTVTTMQFRWRYIITLDECYDVDACPLDRSKENTAGRERTQARLRTRKSCTC